MVGCAESEVVELAITARYVVYADDQKGLQGRASKVLADLL